MADSEQETVVRALRRLTTAVWALTIVVAAFVGLYLALPIASLTWSSSKQHGEEPAASAPVIESLARQPDFPAMPLEKQIDAATVIAIAKYEKVGERNKCVLTEILKQSPGTKFYFKVGDELHHCSHDIKPNETRGDGQVIFFVGNPADFRLSTSFYADRLGGLGNMPVDLFRKQVAERASK